MKGVRAMKREVGEGAVVLAGSYTVDFDQQFKLPSSSHYLTLSISRGPIPLFFSFQKFGAGTERHLRSRETGRQVDRVPRLIG